MEQTGTLKFKKLMAVSDLIRLPKQQGTLLVLWPTLWSLFIASGGRPGAKLFTIFVLGTFLMRSAGCAINDIADRNFDGFVERTKARPLASGSLNVREALFVFIALSSLAFILVLFLNTYTIILSFIGILLAGVYPFVKRVSHYPQAFLGIAFGWGAIMAWSGVKGIIGVIPVTIFAANILWSMAYDTVYALMDKDDDIKIGIKSTAIIFGDKVYKALVFLYIGFCALLGFAGWMAGLKYIYFTGLSLSFIVFLSTVYAIRRSPSRETAFKGFITNAIAGGFILASIILDLRF